MDTRKPIWNRKRFQRNLLYILLAILSWYMVKALADGIPLRIVALTALFVISLISLALVKNHTRLSAELLLLAGFLGVNSAIYTSGGLLSYATAVLAVIPVFALTMTPRRSAHTWLVICILAYAGYLWADIQGIEIANLNSPDDQATHAFFGVCGLLVALYGLSLNFLGVNEGYARKIKSQLRELKDEAFKRHQAEQEARKASEAKSFFLANMSHEIRTPLNGIVGIVDLLNDAPLDDKYRKYIKTLNEASHLLLEQVNDVLDFSKIESGEFQLLETNFSIKECLTGLASLFKLSAEDKGLNFTFTLSDNLPEAVLSDEKCVRQVISNIISNAIKYTQEGHIKLHGNYQKGVLIFTCEDSGMGISEEAQEHLFKPFTQDYSEDNQFIQGTGLGLSITNSLCNMLNGTIEVDSLLKKGSVFTISIPMPARDSLEAQFQKERNVKEFSILVAEDNPVNQLVIKGLLKKIGCPHEVCDDGQLALEYLNNNPLPDLILSDIQMPNMNGYALIEAIRNDERLAHLHVVALTANATAEEHQRTIDSGFNGFLTKPIERSKLLDYMSRI